MNNEQLQKLSYRDMVLLKGYLIQVEPLRLYKD